MVTLFVGGLSKSITENDLFMYFSSYALVTEVNIVRNLANSESKGYGFVTINSIHTARLLVRTKNFIRGRRVECQLASQREDKLKCKEHMKSRKLFVSNIPVTATNQDLEELFSQFGTIHNSYIIRYQDRPINEPYGFVEYENPKDATRLLKSKSVLKLHGARLRLTGYLDKSEQASRGCVKKDAPVQTNQNKECSHPQTEEQLHEIEKDQKEACSDRLEKRSTGVFESSSIKYQIHLISHRDESNYVFRILVPTSMFKVASGPIEESPPSPAEQSSCAIKRNNINC